MNLITSHTRRHPNDEGIQRASASSLWNLTAGNNDNKQASGQVAASTMAAALRRHVRVAPVVEPVLGEGALLLNTIGHAPAGAIGHAPADVREHAQVHVSVLFYHRYSEVRSCM